MKKTTYIEAITEAMREEMERDESVFLIGEDIGIYGGVFKATKGLLSKLMKDGEMDGTSGKTLIVHYPAGVVVRHNTAGRFLSLLLGI